VVVAVVEEPEIADTDIDFFLICCRILIDDRDELATDWERAGGVFVWHTSTETTLQRLRELGVLRDDEAADNQAVEGVVDEA
jgi:hypothetical protein